MERKKKSVSVISELPATEDSVANLGEMTIQGNSKTTITVDKEPYQFYKFERFG